MQKEYQGAAQEMEGASSDYSNRVLVVEDSRMDRLLLVAILTKLGYEVLQEPSAEGALEVLKEIRVGVILSDWMMPGLSGPEFCQIVRKSDMGHPYFILVTARDSTKDLVTGIDSGADEFITKPYNREELLVRVKAGQREIQLRHKLEVQNQQLQGLLAREKAAREQTQKDLLIASNLLMDALPDQHHEDPAYQISGMLQPANELGGDFFNYFSLDETKVGFYLFDVVGHGVPAALYAFMLARMITPWPKELSPLLNGDSVLDPSEVVKNLNDRLADESTGEQYFTIAYVVLDTVTGEGKLCQAGCPHPIILGENGQARQIGNGGFPVGMLSGVDFEDTHFKLLPGDRLAIYSDGITEVQDEEGVQLGTEGLIDLLEKNYHCTLPELLKVTYNYSVDWEDGVEQNDDISILALEWMPG